MPLHHISPHFIYHPKARGPLPLFMPWHQRNTPCKGWHSARSPAPDWLWPWVTKVQPLLSPGSLSLIRFPVDWLLDKNIICYGQNCRRTICLPLGRRTPFIRPNYSCPARATTGTTQKVRGTHWITVTPLPCVMTTFAKTQHAQAEISHVRLVTLISVQEWLVLISPESSTQRRARRGSRQTPSWGTRISLSWSGQHTKCSLLASPWDPGKTATPSQIPYNLVITPWFSLVSHGVSESVKTKVLVPNLLL